MENSIKNPQTLVVHDGFLYVVNTGTFDLSNFENPEVSEPGSVERVPDRRIDKRQSCARGL